MYIIGDIGNTEVKICLISKNFKIKKKINLKTSEISYSKIKTKLAPFIKKKLIIDNVVFSSVVPYVYKHFVFFFKSRFKKKIIEIKKLTLNSLIDIRVNKKQVGSDRLANSIAAIDMKNNFIIIDFGTATTFDVVMKNRYLGGIISPGINLSLSTLSLHLTGSIDDPNTDASFHEFYKMFIIFCIWYCIPSINKWLLR